MLKNTRFWILLSLIAFGLPALAVACGDLDEDECAIGDTNDDGAVCVCTDDSGVACDPDAESEDEDEESSCLCEFATTGGTTTTGTGTTGETTGPDPYLFVLVEDETQNVSGDTEGADLDAISVTKADGTTMFATSVEDFEIASSGAYQDPNAILGAPDSNCQVQNFVALGGQSAGGYIVVGFADGTNDGTFTAGSAITVSEIGTTMCPGTTYDDDPYSVSVSVSKTLSTFTEIATNVNGNNPITVP